MNKSLSPARWAIDISTILNAVPDYTRFPVDVASIARELSSHKFPDDPITLIKGKDLPGFEGAMKKAPPGKTGWGIFYNSGIVSKGRINFTLAHEFGHYLIHRVEHPDGFMCSVEDMSRWDSEYAQLENQANQFAADLLMPPDDFRRNLDPKISHDIDLIGNCAKRYEVSLIATILRLLSLTKKRAMLVVSRDGFVLWSRSSRPAFKSGLYLKIRNRSPIPLPKNSLAMCRSKVLGHMAKTDHDTEVWFKQPCQEQVLFSDQYDFTLSLLYFGDADPRIQLNDEETVEDTFDRFNKKFCSNNSFD